MTWHFTWRDMTCQPPWQDRDYDMKSWLWLVTMTLTWRSTLMWHARDMNVYMTWHWHDIRWNYVTWRNVAMRNFLRTILLLTGLRPPICSVTWPKHGSSVEISAMDSLTPKTWIVKKFRKSIRHIHHASDYVLNRKFTWIFEVTQTW